MLDFAFKAIAIAPDCLQKELSVIFTSDSAQLCASRAMQLYGIMGNENKDTSQQSYFLAGIHKMYVSSLSVAALIGRISPCLRIVVSPRRKKLKL